MKRKILSFMFCLTLAASGAAYAGDETSAGPGGSPTEGLVASIGLDKAQGGALGLSDLKDFAAEDDSLDKTPSPAAARAIAVAAYDAPACLAAERS